MTAREVVGLNASTPQLEVPQSGDTYTMPRDVSVTGDLTVSADVGIGKDPQAWGGAVENALNIGDISFVYVTGNGAQMGLNYYYDGTDDRHISAGIASRFRYAANGNIIIESAVSGSAGGVITWTKSATMVQGGGVQVNNGDLILDSGQGIDFNGGPIWKTGSGTPEGAVTAAIGSLFTRTDGGASTTLYVKESGAGNTGWISK